MKPKNNGKKWTENETILAYYYYCQIPFGKIHQANPEIIRLANLLGRTPASLSFKLGNLGHFDPELRKRNVNGLSNASKLDEEIFKLFSNNWEELAYRATLIENNLSHGIEAEEIRFPEGLERPQESFYRINQDFFRKAVLSNYQYACCITGITIQNVLRACHIKPWKDSDPGSERTNPHNGLCINSLHHDAFDAGLFTILPDYTIRISTKLREDVKSESDKWLIKNDGQKISLPERFWPNKEFLEYHNDMVFLR